MWIKSQVDTDKEVRGVVQSTQIKEANGELNISTAFMRTKNHLL